MKTITYDYRKSVMKYSCHIKVYDRSAKPTGVIFAFTANAGVPDITFSNQEKIKN